MRKIVTTGLCCAAFAGALAAQQAGAPQTPAQPRPLPGVTVEVRNIYNNIKGFITRAADQFPEDKYKWQPTPEVRSWSRLIGHIIDDNNGSCWAMGGLTAAPPRFDTPNSNESAAFAKPKADIVKMLADSFALCDKAFDTLTEANMSERNGTSNRSKFGAMFYNTQHINEHYGNIVTYMRLQGMVPPSSAPRGGGPAF
jgi:hypothetical protein